MLFVIGFVAIGLADALVVLFGGALLYGLGEGSSIPTVQDLVAGAAPEASRGAVVAAWVVSLITVPAASTRRTTYEVAPGTGVHAADNVPAVAPAATTRSVAAAGTSGSS